MADIAAHGGFGFTFGVRHKILFYRRQQPIDCTVFSHKIVHIPSDLKCRCIDFNIMFCIGTVFVHII